MVGGADAFGPAGGDPEGTAGEQAREYPEGRERGEADDRGGGSRGPVPCRRRRAAPPAPCRPSRWPRSARALRRSMTSRRRAARLASRSAVQAGRWPRTGSNSFDPAAQPRRAVRILARLGEPDREVRQERAHPGRQGVEAAPGPRRGRRPRRRWAGPSACAAGAERRPPRRAQPPWLRCAGRARGRRGRGRPKRGAGAGCCPRRLCAARGRPRGRPASRRGPRRARDRAGLR